MAKDSGVTVSIEDGGLIVWDFIKKIYPETMVEEMFSYYCMVIEQLSKNNGELWKILKE